ncbi:S-layer homology domain-containing protein [Ureibacillus aquaedulcis]|uniref:S-layer homology domain-containing protein n=1 Tax=Ureibacillus aquaedulcis TaxID=3058421 RepID=A0ABT8GUR0_9BACL|nr:S-layer homology domain-containing protein [Ureibacillus sp. BA0131]MDN4495127.1 S-layer homology domain-containing protein [Ureibacillus sp. BA0131]
MSGEEILLLSEENKFAFSSDLKKISLNVSETNELNSLYNGYFMFGNSRQTIGFFGGTGNDVIDLYLSPELTRGYMKAESDGSTKFIGFSIDDEEIVRVKKENLARLEALNQENSLPIFTFDNHWITSNNFNLPLEITKKTYDCLSVGVGITEQDETWGYTLSKRNVEISDDTIIEFSGNIEGEITSVLQSPSDGKIHANIELTAENWTISSIFKDIYNDVQETVSISYVLTDSQGKKYTDTVNNYSLHYLELPSDLADGVYTLKLTIPTSPSKSLTLEKEFTIGESANPGDGDSTDSGNGGSTGGETTNPGTGSGNSSGGSSGGNSNQGNQLPQVPVTKVNEADIDTQLDNTAKSEVEINAEVVTETAPNVNVEVSKQALDKLAKSEKNFVINSGEVAITVPSKVLKAISNSATDTIDFKVGLVKNTEILGDGKALSDAYEFTISIGEDAKFSSFEQPIAISLPVEPSEVMDADKVAAYYINEKTNELEFVISKYENGVVTFKTIHFSRFVVVEDHKSFNDVAKNHWAKHFIDSLASKNIVNGKTAYSFAPNDTITRAEFASILARVLNLPTVAYEGEFTDVPKSMTWAVAEIEAANQAGIVLGNNGKFMPNEEITRQQMATMIVRALEYADPSIVENVKNKVRFADAKNVHNYAKEAVTIVSGLGIVEGRMMNGKRLFAPEENATRAEAAKMLYNMLDQLAK